MARVDEMRLMARVARMYYERNMSQAAIAKHLRLSQATVSRLFSRAKEEGIIRITVSIPKGIYTDLEERLIDRFKLREAIVVDSIRDDDESVITRELGAAAGYYLESVIKPKDVIGLSSWSSTLLSLVDSLHPVARKADVRVAPNSWRGWQSLSRGTRKSVDRALRRSGGWDGGVLARAGHRRLRGGAQSVAR